MKIFKLKKMSGKGNKKPSAISADAKAVIWKVTKYLLVVVLAICIIGGGVVAGAVVAYIKTTPPLTDDMLSLKNFNTFVYDDKNVKISELSMNENRDYVTYDQVSQPMKDAIVAIEDERFFKHEGVDWFGLLRAFSNKVLHPLKPMTGASTITMQVIKNITKEDRRSIQRKIQEQWRAIELEKKWAKWQILEVYMNVSVFGPNIYGVQAASKNYFNKDASQLTVAEAACIAGITNNPSIYNVYTTKGRENALGRQKVILSKMLAQGLINQTQYDIAVVEKLVFNTGAGTTAATVLNNQSYFVDQTVLDIKRDLIAQGMSEETAIDLIYNGGLRIYTTMDSSIQKVVDQTFTDDTLWPVPYLGLSYREGAMVILDNSNAQIKAMYGGFGEKKSNTLNRATQIERQPGSVMKPIAVYGPALNERLITPATVIDDAPVYMNGIENPLYPMNYDKTYKGLTTVRDAVRYSLNVVAAQVYADILGTEKPLEYLAKVGIVREQQNVSLALGGLDQGISPLQAAGAFLPFANRGIYFQPSTYTRVEDRLGNIIIQKSAPDPVLVYDESAAYVMNSILQSVTESGTASGTTIVNANGESITTAGKTGTTENNRDHWFVGMTPYYTASTWYGYDNNAEVPQGPEWQQALKLWQIVMRQIHQGLPGKTFAEPQGIVRKEICLRSGKLITSACLEDPLNIATGKPYAPVREEIFIKGTEPKNGDICKVHQVKNVCIESDDGIGRHLIAGPYCPTADLERKVFIERLVPFQQQKADTPFPQDWIYSYDPNRTCNVHTGPGITTATPTATPK